MTAPETDGDRLAGLTPHHRRAIGRWVDEIRARPEHLAVIVAGSLTKGYGRDDSDVDGLVVVTPEAFAERRRTGQLQYFSLEHCDYPGGYVDAKYVDVAFIEAVAARGSEPARSAFEGATVAWSRVDGLDDLLAAAAEYPEQQREDKMMRFMAQVQAMQWYVGEGAKRDDPYLTRWAADRLALFATRLVLAHNRVLYPFHKWMLRRLDEAAEKPEDFGSLLRALVREPSPELAEQVVVALLVWREWPEAPGGWASRFMLDSEWNWLEGDPPVDDL